MLIDWSKYDENIKKIYLESNQITEINWNGCPQGLKEINLHINSITHINWENCPQGLEVIYLNNNQITEINWNGCPQGLEVIYLNNNQITDMNWENCPQGLKVIRLYNNQITHINWNGCPLYLEYVSPYTEKYKNYKQTLEYKMRFYGKENLLRNFITKERRIINDQIVALSYISDNHRVKVFNTKIFKENYYNFLEIIKNDLKTINDVKRFKNH